MFFHYPQHRFPSYVLQRKEGTMRLCVNADGVCMLGEELVSYISDSHVFHIERGNHSALGANIKPMARAVISEDVRPNSHFAARDDTFRRQVENDIARIVLSCYECEVRFVDNTKAMRALATFQMIASNNLQLPRINLNKFAQGLNR